MTDLLKGTNPRVDMAAKIATRLDVSLGWLVGIDDHIPSETVASQLGQRSFGTELSVPPSHVGVPLFSARAAAGNGRAVLSQDVDDYFSLSRDWLYRLVPHGTRVGVMQCDGDSMEPTIRDGDLMIVRFDIDKIRNDGVYVISYEGEIRVKRLTIHLGEVVLSSDNDRYAAERIKREVAEQHLIIHGIVFWSGGSIRAGR
jgi:phage repressor protein C with HTH and peptisase S24 domain